MCAVGMYMESSQYYPCLEVGYRVGMRNVAGSRQLSACELSMLVSQPSVP